MNGITHASRMPYSRCSTPFPFPKWAGEAHRLYLTRPDREPVAICVYRFALGLSDSWLVLCPVTLTLVAGMAHNPHIVGGTESTFLEGYNVGYV